MADAWYENEGLSNGLGIGSFLLGGPIGYGAYSLIRGASMLNDKGVNFNNLGDWVNSYQNASAMDKVAYTKNGVAYDKTSADSIINAANTEYANYRDDTAYDRLFEALKRNGVNPALILSNSASPMASNDVARSATALNAKDQLNSALKVGALLALVIKALAA